MDSTQIVDMLVTELEAEKAELRRQILAELARLSYEAKAAASHSDETLPTLAWVEASVTRLREKHDAFAKVQGAQDALRRVSWAIAFEAPTKNSH